MRMLHGGASRRVSRGTVVAVVVAVVMAAATAAGCVLGRPQVSSPQAAGQPPTVAAPGATPGAVHAAGVSVAVSALGAFVHQVRVDVHGPCPHIQLAPAITGGDNTAPAALVPVLLAVFAAAVITARTGSRGPPPLAALATGGGRYQLCVMRR